MPIRSAVMEVTIPSNDAFGGSGRDFFLFSGNFDDYEYEIFNGEITITDLRGHDGTDSLRQIEDLIFADGRAEYENGQLVFIPGGDIPDDFVF